MSEAGQRLDTPIRALAPLMLGATVAAFVLAIVGALLGDGVGNVAAGGAVGVIVAVPLIRVVILGIHWLRIGDKKFALIAAALLTIVGFGAILALL